MQHCTWPSERLLYKEAIGGTFGKKWYNTSGDSENGSGTFDRSATALAMLWFFLFLYRYVFLRRFHLGPREYIVETTTFSPIFVH